MENNCTKICRFCLKTSDSNLEIIEEFTFPNLDFLWLKLNLSISEEPVMCEDCAKTIRISSDYKTKCLEVENSIVSPIKDIESIKIDLREVYVSKMSLENIVDVPENNMVCRLCLELVKNDSAIFLRKRRELVQNLGQYFPELDLSCTDDPVICASCQVSLQYYFSFLNTCLRTEEKIMEYCKVEGPNDVNQIDLNKVIQFISKDFMKREFEVDTLKSEQTCSEVSENTNYSVEIKKEEIQYTELDIKEERSAQESELTDENRTEEKIMEYCKVEGTNDVDQTDLNKVIQFISKDFIKCEFEVDTLKIEETCSEVSENTNYSVEIKKEEILHTELDIKDERSAQESESTDENSLQQTKTKDYLGKHMKSDLSRHIRSRKSHSETAMYKCETCVFETKHRSSIRQHMLIHMDVSKIKMHKCEMCPFETKRIYSLRRHLLSHSNIPGVVTPGPLFKCYHCDYETKQKVTLQGHMLIHMDVSKIKMHKCEVCPFETKRKRNLRQHLFCHRNAFDVVTPVTMYKCDLCLFETNKNPTLRKHMLTHKTPSETTMYKCETCVFETKYRDYLKEHMLIHKDVSEIKMHKCEMCPFETKWKHTLNRHLLSHSNIPGVVTPGTLFKCYHCDYEATQKVTLQGHMLIHMDVSKIKMHKCEVCPFETKWKGAFRKHLHSHRNTHTVTMYKCYHCDHETKEKSMLKAHMLIHEARS